MGLGQNILTWVGDLGHFFAWVGSGPPPQAGFGKILLKNIKFFNFSCFKSKKSHQARSKNTLVEDRSAFYLLLVKSMIRLGWIRAQL